VAAPKGIPEPKPRTAAKVRPGIKVFLAVLNAPLMFLTPKFGFIKNLFRSSAAVKANLQTNRKVPAGSEICY
jgi:hypothetical protein